MNDADEINRFFDHNVEDYETKHYRHDVRSFMTVRQKRVLEFVDAISLQPGMTALDAGCGPGYLLEALANRKLRVFGMDGAEAMLRSAEARLRAAKPQYPAAFAQGSIENLPYDDESFDLVCSTGVIEYLSHDENFLSEAFRVLKPGGHLLLPVTSLWSPVNYFDFLVEFMKRREWLRRPFNAVWERLGHGPVLPRHFHVRRHRPAALRDSLERAGFELINDIYFYFLPWPRPFDRLAPGISARLGELLEPFGDSWIGPLAEGYLTHSSVPKR